LAEEKFISQNFMESFGLDYPKDLEKFNEVFGKFTGNGGSLYQLFKDLVKTFPDKKEKILNAPMFTTIDGEVHEGKPHIDS
jgi:hypothetical protein